MDRAEQVMGVLMLLCIIILIGVMIAIPLGVGPQVSESTYTGDVADIEEDSGIVFKTTEIRIKTDAEATEPEAFCVHPDRTGDFVPKLRQAQNAGDRVTVTYERGYSEPKWRCDGETEGRRIIDVTIHGGDA